MHEEIYGDSSYAHGPGPPPGVFTFDRYDIIDAAGGDTAKQVGLDMKITFTPGARIVSDKLGFVQVVRSELGGTVDFLNPHQQGRATNAADGQAGWRVDRMDTMRAPTYGESNTGAAGGNTHFGSRTAAGVVDPAWMTDGPTRTRAVGQTVTWRAVTYALDATHNTYHGSTTWGFDCDAAGKVTSMTPTFDPWGAPTGVHLRALERWNTQADDPTVANRNAPDQLHVPVP